MVFTDIRTQNLYEGRSINLALSARGIASLKAVGLADQVVADGVPMYGRMIHGRDGSQHPLNYGLHGEYIISVDRRKLNETLLSAAEAMPNVHIHFDHQLDRMDFAKKEAIFRTYGRLNARRGAARNGIRTPKAHARRRPWLVWGACRADNAAVQHSSDLFIGTDGAFSGVRKQLMKHVRYAIAVPSG